MQSLFKQFEETFHLPALSIEFRYRQVEMSEIVAQKSINVASSIILINKHTECVWKPLGNFLSSKPNSSITHNS